MLDPLHPDINAVRLGDVLRALSDPTRLGIVMVLAENGETLCSTLYETVGVSKSLASHHFRALREAGVIRRNHSGRTQSATLRKRELDERFPGLLDAILGNATIASSARAKSLGPPTSRRPL